MGAVQGKIHIVPADVTFDANEGESLLEILKANGYPIATSCGGVASCGLCRLTVLRGGESLTPIKPQELTHLGNVAKVVGLRLACQSKVCGPGPVVVQVPEIEIVEDRKRRKAERLREEHGHSALPPSSKRARVPRHSELPVATRSPQGGGPAGEGHERPSHEGPRSEHFDGHEGPIEWRPRILHKRGD